MFDTFFTLRYERKEMALFYYYNEKPELGPAILDRPMLTGIDQDGEVCFDYMTVNHWATLDRHLEERNRDPEVKYKTRWPL